MAAPLADDSKQRAMYGEFINPLHYHSNPLQQFPVSSMAPMGMVMGHISVGLLDHSGWSILPFETILVNFALNLCHSESLILASGLSTAVYLLLTPDAS